MGLSTQGIKSRAEAKAEDQALVERAQLGDTSAFERLYVRYWDRLVRQLSNMVGDAAEDVAQDAFLKARHALTRFRGEGAFYSWLYSIASNTAKNYLRNNASGHDDGDDDGDDERDEESPPQKNTSWDHETPNPRLLGAQPLDPQLRDDRLGRDDVLEEVLDDVFIVSNYRVPFGWLLHTALYKAQVRTGLRGDPLMDLLDQYRAGCFYPQSSPPTRPKDGLSVGAKPMETYTYHALRGLDGTFKTWHLWLAKKRERQDAERARLASSDKRVKGTAVSAKNRKGRTAAAQAEWRAIAHELWGREMTVGQPQSIRAVMAVKVCQELAIRYPATKLPAVATIEDALKGVKKTVLREMVRTPHKAKKP